MRRPRCLQNKDDRSQKMRAHINPRAQARQTHAIAYFLNTGVSKLKFMSSKIRHSSIYTLPCINRSDLNSARAHRHMWQETDLITVSCIASLWQLHHQLPICAWFMLIRRGYKQSRGCGRQHSACLLHLQSRAYDSTARSLPAIYGDHAYNVRMYIPIPASRCAGPSSEAMLQQEINFQAAGDAADLEISMT